MTLPLLDESAAMSATTPVVIGLDLSLTGTGFAGPDGTKVFRSTGHKGDTLDQRADRLTALLFDVLDAIDDWNVDLVTIEQPSFGQSCHHCPRRRPMDVDLLRSTWQHAGRFGDPT